MISQTRSNQTESKLQQLWQRLKQQMVQGEEEPKAPSLTEQVQQAKQAWQEAMERFNLVDSIYAEAAILALKAAEANYEQLIREVKAGRA